MISFGQFFDIISFKNSLEISKNKRCILWSTSTQNTIHNEIIFFFGLFGFHSHFILQNFDFPFERFNVTFHKLLIYLWIQLCILLLCFLYFFHHLHFRNYVLLLNFQCINLWFQIINFIYFLWELVLKFSILDQLNFQYFLKVVFFLFLFAPNSLTFTAHILKLNSFDLLF